MRNARKEAVFINNKAWKHRSAALSWKAACWLRWRWTRLKSSAQSKFSSGKNLRGCYHIWACTSEACVYTLWAWNIHVTIHEWEAQARVVGVISYVSMHEWGLCAHLVGVEYTCHHTRVSVGRSNRSIIITESKIPIITIYFTSNGYFCDQQHICTDIVKTGQQRRTFVDFHTISLYDLEKKVTICIFSSD